MATAKKSARPKVAKSKASAKVMTRPTAKPAKKTTIVQAARSESGSRRVKTPRRRFLRRQDKRFKARPKLPNVFRITKMAGQLLLSNWKIIGGMIVVYGLLNIVLVRGLNGGANVSDLKSQVDGVFNGSGGHLASGLTVFGLLLTSTNNVASADASSYQTFLLVVISLALVWSYRQLAAGNRIRIRDGFYRGMAPLIPVLLVLVVIGLELIPIIIGGWAYSLLIQNGIVIDTGEQLVSLAFVFLLLALSLYLASSTLFALYIATLPDMTPLRAMRSARELVRYRRWAVIRKLLFLPLMLLIIGAIIMLPFILFVAVLAQWIFFVLTMIALAVTHAYIYRLYRELLNE